jgi:hypothetical protein
MSRDSSVKYWVRAIPSFFGFVLAQGFFSVSLPDRFWGPSSLWGTFSLLLKRPERDADIFVRWRCYLQSPVHITGWRLGTWLTNILYPSEDNSASSWWKFKTDKFCQVCLSVRLSTKQICIEFCIRDFTKIHIHTFQIWLKVNKGIGTLHEYRLISWSVTLWILK